MMGHADRFRWRGAGCVLAAMVLTLAGCDMFGPRISDADIRRIQPQRVGAMRGEGGIVLLDVRSRAAFERGHIQGAIHAPLPSLEPGDPRFTEGEKRLIVYGQSAQDPLPPAAAKKLLSQGYERVFVLAGGWQRWQQGVGEPGDG